MMDIEKTVLKNVEQISNHEARIAALETLTADIHRLATSVEIIANEQKTMDDNISSLMEKLDDVEHRPAKVAAVIVTAIITAFITAAVSFLFTKI